MSVVNWGEVYYILTRVTNKETALEAMRTIETLPIEVIMADKEITLIAAEFKATHKMSYADCFAAALAKVKKAELITGDKEFKQVGSNIRVEWI
jgi:ribonuclease VapC